MKIKPEGQTPNSKKKQTPLLFPSQEIAPQEDAHLKFLVNNFQGDTKYYLNNLNSIFFKDGKIYNLLQRNSAKKSFKCGCVKSSCSARYCECFRNGQVCGDQCECADCKNKNPRKNANLRLTTGCKCLKSGCSKKYCECFQKGKKCGVHCQCVQCCNKE